MRRTAPVLVCLGLLLLTACGDSSSDTSGGSGSAACGAAANTVKPKVTPPTSAPTELVITDLTKGGCGEPAAIGDTVIVQYVGVRTADGTEFDNSYDRGEPFEVSLGAGSVIKGWDQGLVGVRQGGRRQLDIPAELAYGDNPPGGDVIKAGDALTFVIDVVAVLPGSKAEDDPGIEVKGAGNIDAPKSTELLTGTGPTPEDGQTVAIRLVAYRADTGELLSSSWGGPPVTFTFSSSSADVYPGLVEAVKGMKVGGRRQVQLPFASMFDGAGNDSLGLPASIDLVLVLDLVAVY